MESTEPKKVVLNLSEEMSHHGRYKPIIGCIAEDANTINPLYECAKNRGIEVWP